MTIESYLNEILEVVLSGQSNASITAEQLIHSIDLTLLDEQAPIESLFQLYQDARINKVAAVCVYSQHLFRQLNTIRLATVINFPQGNEELIMSLKSIEKAIQSGANEIDYVLPYRRYLDGEQQETLNQCRAVIESCKKNNLTLKIILETGAFPELQNIYEVSSSLIELGCDFLKTSTGKIPQGASIPAAFTILSAIKDSGVDCGLKVSGGVKTPLQAFNYAKLAELVLGKKINKTWFRIGASSLLGELLTAGLGKAPNLLTA